MFKNSVLTLVLATATIAIVSISPTKSFAAGKIKGADNIKAAVVGSFNASGRNFSGRGKHNANGTLSGTNTKTGKKYTGNWSIKGDKFCWKSNESGWKGCGSVREKRNGDISISGYATLKK